ncbi:MAG: hypothetical protein GF355_09955 [Candidatus Eisenbacteria bacterium]|nr:hypothetical protein [Candidatus Eisenbacteria bacterium]
MRSDSDPRRREASIPADLPVSRHVQQRCEPKHNTSFRIIRFFTHLQLAYLIRSKEHARTFGILYVFFQGALALGIITAAAFLTKFPLLFPPLGPSAFILFSTPMAPGAAPRNVILSHTIACAAGLLALYGIGLLFPGAHLQDPAVMNWPRVWVIALAMGMTGALMMVSRTMHPPAAATALIAALGHLGSPVRVIGLLAAVVLLVIQAYLFNRVVGGLPYPLWRSDPAVMRHYGCLAGIPDGATTFWQRMTERVFLRR